MLEWLILFRPLLPNGISLLSFDLSEQFWEGILMCSDLQEKNWLSRKYEFVVNKHSIVKFLNLVSFRVNSICCNKKPVKLEFVTLPGLSSKGVACAMPKSI